MPKKNEKEVKVKLEDGNEVKIIVRKPTNKVNAHVEQGEFFDEKLGMRGQQNEMYKNKFR